MIVALLPLALSSCVKPPPPAPATMSEAAPPWPAPRDAISYIEASGLPQERYDTASNQRRFQLSIEVGGEPVAIPAWIGVDRYRAIQAPVHTHTEDGEIWLEGEGAEEATLGQFFTLWGVRMNADCLGAVCGGVQVSVDDVPLASDPTALKLVDVNSRLEIAID